MMFYCPNYQTHECYTSLCPIGADNDGLTTYCLQCPYYGDCNRCIIPKMNGIGLETCNRLSNDETRQETAGNLRR